MSEMTAHQKGIHAAYEHLEGYPDIERAETIIRSYLEASGLVLVPRDEDVDFFMVKDFADGWIYFPDEDGALIEARETGALAVSCRRIYTPAPKPL